MEANRHKALSRKIDVIIAVAIASLFVAVFLWNFGLDMIVAIRSIIAGDHHPFPHFWYFDR